MTGTIGKPIVCTCEKSCSEGTIIFRENGTEKIHCKTCFDNFHLKNACDNCGKLWQDHQFGIIKQIETMEHTMETHQRFCNLECYIQFNRKPTEKPIDSVILPNIENDASFTVNYDPSRLKNLNEYTLSMFNIKDKGEFHLKFISSPAIVFFYNNDTKHLLPSFSGISTDIKKKFNIGNIGVFNLSDTYNDLGTPKVAFYYYPHECAKYTGNIANIASIQLFIEQMCIKWGVKTVEK